MEDKKKKKKKKKTKKLNKPGMMITIMMVVRMIVSLQSAQTSTEKPWVVTHSGAVCLPDDKQRQTQTGKQTKRWITVQSLV